MFNSKISIDNLIAIVARGGKVKTGIDVYNAKGVLLLEKDVLVNNVKTLEIIKSQGIRNLPLNPDNYGGVWDEEGNYIRLDSDGSLSPDQGRSARAGRVTAGDGTAGAIKKNRKSAGRQSGTSRGEIERRLNSINELKVEANNRFQSASKAVRKAFDEIKSSGGEFDYRDVEAQVSDLVSFFSQSDNPFAYLSKEILNYDAFLYSHSINVCAIGTSILNRFNISFSNMVNHHIEGVSSSADDQAGSAERINSGSYRCFFKDEIIDIATGFFIHDIGKLLIPGSVLNKTGKLTVMEFEMIKKHSYGLGIQILEKNRLRSSVLKSIVSLHHAPLFNEEKRCYPENVRAEDIPFGARICKLADMYDAMTSKRCYREAFNPINVVTEIFRKYAGKDKMLQFILHAFVKSMGIYPVGSVIYLKNGQLAYVLESAGPLVLPFTDRDGGTLSASDSSPIDLGDDSVSSELKADSLRSVRTPLEVYDLLPAWLKQGSGSSI